MKKWQIGLVGLFVLVALGAIIYSVQKEKGQVLGNRMNMTEVTLFTTSTNANYTGIPVVNVNDYEYIGYTVVGESASGTVKFLCSMQDTAITTAASSTSNRWDYVDATLTNTEASIDGYTGVTLSNSNFIQHYVVRNSVWKWCSAMLSGNTTPAGYGTTTVYMKRVQNQ